MSDSVWPHRWQPTRLPRPWDSPGKNTGVGCHFLLQRMKVKSENEVAQSCPTLSYPMDCSLPGSSVHGIFQAKVLEWGAIAFSVMIAIFSYIFNHKIKYRWDLYLIIKLNFMISWRPSREDKTFATRKIPHMEKVRITGLSHSSKAP